jgi:heme exporter protein B
VMGTTFSALTVNLRLRELMLPVLVYPMLLPAMLASFRMLTALVAGQPIGPGDAQWVRLLIGFDVIFTSLALALAEFILVT